MKKLMNHESIRNLVQTQLTSRSIFTGKKGFGNVDISSESPVNKGTMSHKNEHCLVDCLYVFRPQCTYLSQGSFHSSPRPLTGTSVGGGGSGSLGGPSR